LNHGISVWTYLQKLLGKDWVDLKIPVWLKDNYKYIVDNIHDLNVVRDYAINHDCGKHLTKIVGQDGKVHYPDHARASYEFWLEHCPEKTTEARLILNDMFFHTCSSQELEETSLSKTDLFTLLITALAEIHSNAALFGGIESTSFKVKYKQLERRGNQLLKKVANEHSKTV